MRPFYVCWYRLLCIVDNLFSSSSEQHPRRMRKSSGFQPKLNDVQIYRIRESE